MMRIFLAPFFLCHLLQNICAADLENSNTNQGTNGTLASTKTEQAQEKQSQPDQEILNVVRQYFDIPYSERPNPISVGDNLFKQLSPTFARKAAGTTAPGNNH